VQVKTKNLLVVGLGVALALLVWWRFVYSSYESSTTKAKQATADAETRLKALQQQVRAATGEGTKKQASLEDLQNAIPSTPQLSAFLREVDTIRNQVGIPEAFQSITPSPPTIAGTTASINLGITASGSYDQMIDYVNRLNKVSRLVVIDNVTFTAGASNQNGGGNPSAGPTGKVFAGQGAAPSISVQLSARLFMQSAGIAAPGAANGGAGGQATGGGGPPTGVQNG
jgi:Tfp pilus assembly protein PilO